MFTKERILFFGLGVVTVLAVLNVYVLTQFLRIERDLANHTTALQQHQTLLNQIVEVINKATQK